MRSTLMLVLAAATLFGATAPANALDLTAAERQWLEHHPVVRIGPDPNFPPFEFLDEQGRYQGIAADYIALV